MRSLLGHIAVVVLLAASGCERVSTSDADKQVAISDVNNSAAGVECAQVGLRCAQPHWDLGEVLVKGSKVDFEHVFKLKNGSSKPIRIQDVQSTCGCLVAKDYSREIPANGTVDLKVTFSVYGPPGPFERSISVSEAGGDSKAAGRSLSLTVRGRRAVSEQLYALPDPFSLGEIPQGASRIRTLSIARYDGSTIAFERFRCQSADLRLRGSAASGTRVDPLGRQSPCLELPLEVDSSQLPLGPFRMAFKVTAAPDSVHASEAEVEVAAVGVVVPTPSPWVKALSVRDMTPERPVTLSLLAPGVRGGAPKILALSFEGDAGLLCELGKPSAKAEQDDDAIRTVVVLCTIENRSMRYLRGVLRLTVDHPSAGEVIIPVVACLAGKAAITGASSAPQIQPNQPQGSASSETFQNGATE